MNIGGLWRSEGLAAVSRRLNRGGRWAISDYGSGDERACLAMFASVYGQPMTEAHWRWKYGDNGDADPIRLVARETTSGRVVGFYGALPSAMLVDGKPGVGYMHVDSMVAPDFRGRGLYIDMTLHLFERMLSRPGGFGLGLPNANAASANVSLGVDTLDTLRLHGRVLRWTGLAAAAFRRGPRRAAAGPPIAEPGSGITTENDFPDGMEDFTARALAGRRAFARRSTRRLRWRYLAHPERPYTILFHRDAGALAGYAVVRALDRKRIRLGVIVDFVHDPALTDGRPLLSAALTALRRSGADAAVAMTSSLSPDRSLYRRAGFLSSRLRWTRRPFHLVGLERDAGGAVAAACRPGLRDPRGLHFTFGDTDIA